MSTDIVKLNDIHSLGVMAAGGSGGLDLARCAQCCQGVSELVVCLPALVNSSPTDLRMK